VVAAEMDIAGELFECRTRETSCVPVSSHRSTTSMYLLLSSLAVSVIVSCGDQWSYLGSISCPVIASRITSLIHGGGVIGLRS
jgi:hypothetical protein